MFETLVYWLLLPLGVVLGLGLGRKREGEDSPRHSAASVSGSWPPSTVPGDAARNNFSEGAAADPGVIELQMTLGSLFRKRGEVERAIRLHEAVLANPSLPAPAATLARHELAQDYLSAGLMDRAEALLQALVDEGRALEPALESLLDLYEQGRDWPQAIATARRLESVLGSSLVLRIGQYLCELAESARDGGDLDAAKREAERALDADPGCARASLLLAGLAEQQGDWAAAIRAYGRAIDQDRRYLPEVLEPLRRIHEAADDAKGYAQFLDDTEVDHPDSVAVFLAKSEWLRARGRDAQSYLADRLVQHPDWSGLLLWLEGQADDQPAAVKVRSALRRRIEARPRYACSACGLTPGVLFWQCPSCKQWASVAPANDGI